MAMAVASAGGEFDEQAFLSELWRLVLVRFVQQEVLASTY
jgi:tellurite resistance protein